MQNPFVSEQLKVNLSRTIAITSSISSSIIIYVILKSRQKLTCIYNRIIFGMSVANFIGCTAMACSLANPTRATTRNIENIRICEASAFFLYFGIM